ncbi:hypothetical protein BH11GEM2_BH11GEM2_39490 [soil metagenome]
MAHRMAVISKAVFERTAPGTKVGDVLPIDRYTSSNKALDDLGEVGKLVIGLRGKVDHVLDRLVAPSSCADTP